MGYQRTRALRRIANGHWQCKTCRCVYVIDRLLYGEHTHLEVHRLTCEYCAAVGHYDRDTSAGNQPARTVNGSFEWVGVALPPSKLVHHARDHDGPSTGQHRTSRTSSQGPMRSAHTRRRATTGGRHVRIT